ncbi:MAG: ribonuclease Y [Anaerolineae bacterium]|nr:ribonuclease Y [Anaerolineae bacterium]NUQ03713.1 ribonuclease Y [Anaerolineae bacterium]
MEFIVPLIIGIAIGAVIGIAVFNNYQNSQGRNRKLLAEEEAKAITAKANEEGQRTLRESEEKARLTLEEVENTAVRRRRELDKEDERLLRRRDELDKIRERQEQREQSLNKRQSKLDKQQTDLQKLQDERVAELTRIAQLTTDEARAELLAAVETEARNDMARIIRQVEAEAHDEADNRAREVISLAVQRLASEHISEIAVSVVPLPSDEMKGRIIGRAGRNIRAFELATGVDVVVDDTPEAVTISSFDPVRREVARRALAKLVVDGRIHPARIEKLVEDARAEVEQIIRQEGERAAYETGIPGLHPEILKLLGRLKFRTSYGQNQHAHSIETAHIAGMIAAELGADIMIAKTGGLLHDLGKAIDHEVEGTHALIGAEFIKRYGVQARIINCVASHHHEVEQECVEAYIVEAADAISGARPGARRESMETYIRRVKTLEEIANSFDGVEQSYALQAGREIRIIVRPEQLDELAALRLSREVAKKIEETMQYPGQIKVQVIRETRAVEFAK